MHTDTEHREQPRREREDDGAGGARAERVRDIPKAGWWDVARRVKREIKDDRLTMAASSVAFYAFLALFPALAAIISIWGLVADPAAVQQQIASLGAIPSAARDLITQTASRIAAGSTAGLGLGFAVSLALTLWSANKGMKGLVEAVNVAYDERDDRGFIKQNAVSLVLTLGAVLLVIVTLGLVIALPIALGAVGLGAAADWAIRLARWPILAGMIVVALSVVYRVGPHREDPRWRWVTPGSLVATALWLIGSVLFSVYVSNFGSFNETYGSVAAVAIMLVWFYLSAFVVLLGAEINAETEKQTARDTTTGREEPMGERGAAAADTRAERPSLH